MQTLKQRFLFQGFFERRENLKKSTCPVTFILTQVIVFPGTIFSRTTGHLILTLF